MKIIIEEIIFTWLKKGFYNKRFSNIPFSHGFWANLGRLFKKKVVFETEDDWERGFRLSGATGPFGGGGGCFEGARE